MTGAPGPALRRAIQRATPWWWLVVAFAIAGIAVGHVVSSRLLSYRATTTLLVGVPTDTAFVQPDDVMASTDLARVLAQMIPQEQVLGGVVSQLGLDQSWRTLRSNVHATVAGHSSRLIVVTADARTPDAATAILRAIPGQLASAAFPNAPSDDARTFLWSRIDAVRGQITSAERQVAVLERQHAARPDDGQLARRLDDARNLVDRWDASLASLYRELQGATSADHVQVLDTPSIASEPFLSEIWLDLALALLGAIVAVVIANRLATHAQRRLGAEAAPAYAS